MNNQERTDFVVEKINEGKENKEILEAVRSLNLDDFNEEMTKTQILQCRRNIMMEIKEIKSSQSSLAYVPPEIENELKKLKSKLKQLKSFQEEPKNLEMIIKKLDVDIETYERAIDILENLRNVV